MKAKIDRLNDTADGVCYINDKITFVSKTLPGEEIELYDDILEYKHNNKAKMKSITIKSSDRVEPKCSYYNECGGCNLMHTSYKYALEYKKNKVINIFKKYANVQINPIINYDEQFNYRNKITLHVKDKKIGLYKDKTNEIVEIDECCLVKQKINDTIKKIKEYIDLTYINEILIREFNNEILIKFTTTKEFDIKELVKNTKYISSIYFNDTCIYGKKYLIENLNNFKYRISPNSFFQINHNITLMLYDKIKEYINDNEKVLDLYCGVASIGIYVSDKASQVYGIEINPSSVENAKENIKLNNLANVSVSLGNVGKVLKSNNYYDTVIVDPPRSGLDKNTINTLFKINSKKIIYVSCDPMTLARDIKILEENYSIKHISLFDMFPNTHHVETVVVLERI